MGHRAPLPDFDISLTSSSLYIFFFDFLSDFFFVNTLVKGMNVFSGIRKMYKFAVVMYLQKKTTKEKEPNGETPSRNQKKAAQILFPIQSQSLLSALILFRRR